jgi:hypothetical protein
MAELHTRQSIDQEMAAVALGKYGEDTVSFFGDVNHERDRPHHYGRQGILIG